MITSLVNERINYGWNRETVVAVSIPVLSSYIQRVQKAFLSEPISVSPELPVRQIMELLRPRIRLIHKMKESHFLGHIVQTVTCLALALLLHPAFLIPTALGAFETLLGAVSLMTAPVFDPSQNMDSYVAMI